MSAWTTIQAEQMEATECQAHMGTQTDGPVKRAHAPRCSHPRRLWGGSTLTCVCYPAKGAFLCHFHQIVSSLWFSWHVETTGTFWLSLTLHILTSAVKTNKRLQSSDADCSRSLSWNLIRLQSAASNLGQLSAGDDILKKGILLNSCSCWVFFAPSCCPPPFSLPDPLLECYTSLNKNILLCSPQLHALVAFGAEIVAHLCFLRS